MGVKNGRISKKNTQLIPAKNGVTTKFLLRYYGISFPHVRKSSRVSREIFLPPDGLHLII